MDIGSGVLGTLLLLIGLELVLGVDNIILVSVIADRCPPDRREFVRRTGIAAAAVGRLLLLAGITWVMKLQATVVRLGGLDLSWKDLILLAGGGFLLFKAVKEMHHAVEHPGDAGPAVPGAARAATTVGAAIGQILLLDLVFSIDSVITAVGLTGELWVMYAAVLLSVGVILAVSGPIARFIRQHPSLKVLALAFLIVIGVTIVLEGLHHHVEKQMIYLPLGFALAIELLQLRQSGRLRRAAAGPGPGGHGHGA